MILMKYNLTVKDGKYCLEIIDVDEKKINRIYDQNRIIKIISNFNEYANTVIEYNNKIKFIYEDKIVTLSQYQENKDKELYSFMNQTINNQTRIIKNIQHVNKKKIITLALTGAVMLSLTVNGVVALANERQSNNQLKVENIVTPTVTPIPTPTVTPTPTATPTPTPTPTATPTPTPIPETIARLIEVDKLRNNEISNTGIVPVSTNLSDNYLKRITDFFETKGWDYIQKYSLEFGIDPYLLLAIGCKESDLLHEKTLPNASGYNGTAVGRFQHEKPNKGGNITAFNYVTNTNETVIMSMENAINEEMNTKMAAMILQKNLKCYNNNIYLTIQSYNYGPKAMNAVIENYANEMNCSIEDVKNNYFDIGWLKYVYDLHNNPNDYLDGWEYQHYGDELYLQKVLGYYIGTETINYDSNGNIVIFNLIDNYNEVKSR